VGRAERIVIALGPFGETGKPATGAQGADAIAAPGQDLVRIGLMANVPDQAIAGRVEDVVDGRRQFDDTEAGAEMSAGDRDGVDGFLAQLIGDLLDLLDLEMWSQRYSNFAGRDELRREAGARYQCSKNPGAGCQLGKPKPDLKA
jgi:hypothetical protein